MNSSSAFKPVESAFVSLAASAAHLPRPATETAANTYAGLSEPCTGSTAAGKPHELRAIPRRFLWAPA